MSQSDAEQDYASMRKYLDRKPDFKMKPGVDSDDPYAGQTDTERFKTRRAQELNDGRPQWPRAGGLFSDLEESILDSAIEPVREIALAGAIAVGAALATRSKLMWNSMGPHMTHPNIYLGLIAESGIGKTSMAKGPRELIDHIGMLGSGRYRSAQGIYFDMDDRVSELPSQLPENGKNEPSYERIANHRRVDHLDEFSGILRNMNQKGGAAHQSGISEIMCELFSASSGIFNKGRVAGRNATIGPLKIAMPCVSFWGSSTNDGFINSIVKENFMEGLLPRMFLLFSSYSGKSQFNASMFPVEHFKKELDKIMTLYEMKNHKRDGHGFLNVSPVAEKKAVKEFVEHTYALTKTQIQDATSGELKAVLARSQENMSKLALCLLGFRGDTEIRLTDMEWAADMVVHQIRGVKEFIEEFKEGPETERERDIEILLKRIKGMADEKGVVFINQLKRKSKKLIRKGNGYFDSLLSSLKEEGNINLDNSSKIIQISQK